MATTPKRTLKQTLASTVEDRSPRYLLGSLALAMVISLLAGLGIGMKIEQHRIKTKKVKPVATRPRTTVKKPTKGGKITAALLANAPVAGNLANVTPKLLVVTTARGRVVLTTLPKTRYDLTSPATAADISVGSRVRFVLKPSGTTTTAGGSTTSGGTPATPALAAKEILVVTGPAKAGLGSLVTAVTPDSMTIQVGKTKSVTITTTGAQIEKSAVATRGAAVIGKRVLVRTYLSPPPKRTRRTRRRALKRIRYAVEVVVLPAGSTMR